MMRAFEWISSQDWAMTEEALRGVLEIAARENPSVEAVEAKLGRPLDNTQTTTVRDGIAIIPIEGPIFPKANLMTELSGATSVQIAARDFNAALDDKSIDGIILNVDSPGGNLGGIHEFQQMIFDARKKKPIKTYSGGIMASAALAIGSASEELVIDRTATVGSLGVVTSVPDPSKRAAKDVEIVSSQSPKKRVDVSTESGKALIQARLNEQADILLGYVARNRGVDVADLLAIEGDVRIGQKAVAAKLADRTGSLESLIKEMSAAAAATKEKNMSVSIMQRLRAALAGTPVVAEETPATSSADPNAELDAALGEIEVLRAKATQADALIAEKAEAEAKEKALRIDAEASSFMEKHGNKFGKAAALHFAARLKAAKSAGDTAAIADLEAVATELPPVGPTNRLAAGGPSPEEIAAKMTPVPENEVGRVAAERLKKRGVAQGSPAWATEYPAEVAKIRAEGGTHEAK